MEIAAINNVSQPASEAGAVRASPPPLRESGVDAARRVAEQSRSQTEVLGQSQVAAQAREKSLAQPAATEAQPAVGRIRFEVDDGTRVAKFFDTKDVLIYQVPPEGTLYLVRLREESGQEQVETTA